MLLLYISIINRGSRSYARQYLNSIPSNRRSIVRRSRKVTLPARIVIDERCEFHCWGRHKFRHVLPLRTSQDRYVSLLHPNREPIQISDILLVPRTHYSPMEHGPSVWRGRVLIEKSANV
ncbi:hypothetical protein CEXT_373961 [Caerostris extrusa]|uniref:Uncharacterized protein n=1 Tax=Caerostris extrusa TaxID=172846 RepID=A0AAV4M381_CAEEX|nr:hypothetical protein CEXT_373961 [Caerostris extrusa]